MTQRTLRVWIVFILAFMVPMQTFASAIRCHNPTNAASHAESDETHHASHDMQVPEMPVIASSYGVSSARSGLASDGLSYPDSTGNHSNLQDACLNCAPCHASAPLLQTNGLQLSESRAVHAVVEPVERYRSVLVSTLDRPPR